MMERLTLYMALRLSGHQDTTMPEQESLTPLLLPILLRLGEYARALQQATKLPLYDYIMQALTEMKLPGLSIFMQKELARGSCLVILDGLDEVSDQQYDKRYRKRLE